jgi:hypothetical protein
LSTLRRLIFKLLRFDPAFSNGDPAMGTYDAFKPNEAGVIERTSNPGLPLRYLANDAPPSLSHLKALSVLEPTGS